MVFLHVLLEQARGDADPVEVGGVLVGDLRGHDHLRHPGALGDRAAAQALVDDPVPFPQEGAGRVRVVRHERVGHAQPSAAGDGELQRLVLGGGELLRVGDPPRGEAAQEPADAAAGLGEGELAFQALQRVGQAERAGALGSLDAADLGEVDDGLAVAERRAPRRRR